MSVSEQLALDDYRQELSDRARDHGASVALWTAAD